jgi:hypothetical protein
MEYSHIKPEQISYSPSTSPPIFLFVDMLYGGGKAEKNNPTSTAVAEAAVAA